MTEITNQEKIRVINKHIELELKEKQELILTQLTSDLRANASYFKKIHLTPEISFEGNCYFLSLRIGYDKEYVIKNISELEK